MTARLYVEFCPETNAPLSVLTMRRSACVAEALLVDDVLFALFGSGVALLTDGGVHDRLRHHVGGERDRQRDRVRRRLLPGAA